MPDFDVFDAGERLPDPLPSEPFALLAAWFDEAQTAKNVPNPNAMTLATVDPDGHPSARVVLCKGIDAAGGTLTFFTNYQSRKGLALTAHPRAAVVFHWDHADRQARVEGAVERVSDAESDAYFSTRAWESRVGAWASAQSQPIESREALLEKVMNAILNLGIDLGAAMRGDPVRIPRPSHWGGYRILADRVELWVGGTGRVHDRAGWTRSICAGKCTQTIASAWVASRIQP